MEIISVASLAFILGGLYFTLGSYVGYIRSVEVCQNYACSTQPIFPTASVFIGLTLIVMGMAALIMRSRLKEFVDYKRNLKIALSGFLIVVASWLHLAITQPCKNPVGRMCDYTVGFPVGFWIVTDYIDSFMLIWFFIGITMNFVIWYFLLSLIFHSIQKLTLKH